MTSTRQSIDAANQQFMAACDAHDPERLAALYTKTGQVFATHSPVVTGHDAIAGFWQQVLSQGVTGARLETLEFEPQGDIGYEVGRYTLMADNAVADVGKYSV